MYDKHLEALITAWSEGKLDALDTFLSAETVRRAPASLKSDANSLAELKTVITKFRTAFPDAKVTLLEAFYQDGRSFGRWRFTGTNTGPGDFPPTGKAVKIEGGSFGRYSGGKLVEEIVYFDALDMMAQLGLVAPPPAS